MTFLNPVAEALTGWTLGEVCGLPVQAVFHIINEETHRTGEDPVRKVLDTGNIVGLANHTLLVRKDGTEVPIDDSGAPIIDGWGHTTGVVLVFRDISARRQAENALRQSEARFRSVLDNSRDLIYRENLQTGRYEYISPSAELLTGYSAADFMCLEEEALLSLAHPNDLPAFRSALARLFATGKAEVEYRLKRKAVNTAGSTTTCR